MALTSGTKLGPYEIQSPLGAGGMGEVYRAQDTRLDRIVAIKVLPSHLSSDPELQQRMEREAKAISALQHANICTLYDIGSQDGGNFLVMEYLEGQTLAERLQKGPLPLDQVLKIGTEIAQALEKAHQQGIIHRDLKPANVMLTKAGAKLMDFGLAKPKLSIGSQAIGPFTPSTPTMNLVSLTSAASPLTQKGSIVGTFQYMAPEVLQGAEADARSDLFSFGCVLYEMVTGRRAFEGKSQLSVFTAILEKDPEPIIASQPLAPRLLDCVIRACLAKDPAERFQSAHDLAMDLRWMAESASTESANSSSNMRFSGPWAAGLTALLLAFIALAAFSGYRWAKFSETPLSLHAEIPPPDKFSLDTTGDAGGMPVLSSLGDKLAFVAHSGENKLLWVRSLSSDTAQPLQGTAGASHPFWSPDGLFIGFFAAGKVMKISANGGPAATVADAPNSRGGSWSANNVIVFAPDFTGALMKVSAQGGTAEPATVIDRTKHTTQRWPWFLPDGKHFLFLSTSHTGGDPKQNGIYFGSVDSTQARLVLAADSAAQYASGYLLYRLNTALVAQPFDPSNGTVSGSPTPVVTYLRDDVGVWRSIFSVSQKGLMVYQLGSSDSAKSHLVMFDRSGKTLADYDPQENNATNARGLLGVRDVRLSPDNKRVAFASGNGIWTLDLARQTRTRITFDEQVVQEPAWSPDGKIAHVLGASYHRRRQRRNPLRNRRTAAARKNTICRAEQLPHPRLVARRKISNLPLGRWRENGFPLDKARQRRRQAGSGRAAAFPAVQPLLLSNFSRRPLGGLRIRRIRAKGDLHNNFPEGKGKWRVSTNSGAYPTWSGNGKELFFKDLTDNLFVCPVTTKGSEIEVGTPQHLFHAASPGIGISFDATSDGKRLLVNHSEDEGQVPLQLVTNWPAELKK